MFEFEKIRNHIIQTIVILLMTLYIQYIKIQKGKSGLALKMVLVFTMQILINLKHLVVEISSIFLRIIGFLIFMKIVGIIYG